MALPAALMLTNWVVFVARLRTYTSLKEPPLAMFTRLSEELWNATIWPLSLRLGAIDVLSPALVSVGSTLTRVVLATVSFV